MGTGTAVTAGHPQPQKATTSCAKIHLQARFSRPSILARLGAHGGRPPSISLEVEPDHILPKLPRTCPNSTRTSFVGRGRYSWEGAALPAGLMLLHCAAS